jgi:hypothetical protein
VVPLRKLRPSAPTLDTQKSVSANDVQAVDCKLLVRHTYQDIIIGTDPELPRYSKNLHRPNTSPDCPPSAEPSFHTKSCKYKQIYSRECKAHIQCDLEAPYCIAGVSKCTEIEHIIIKSVSTFIGTCITTMSCFQQLYSYRYAQQG